MHYQSERDAAISRPVMLREHGFLVTPMARGLRLTTGAEFAKRDAPATPVQLDAVEPIARSAIALGVRLDARPWLGARPCVPDMLPLIGPVPGQPGLWVNSAHHHLGLTLGPVSGRLVVEMMTGAEPFTDPAPYRVGRFQ
jgi:D-amino-acid dehydrogenase